MSVCLGLLVWVSKVQGCWKPLSSSSGAVRVQEIRLSPTLLFIGIYCYCQASFSRARLRTPQEAVTFCLLTFCWNKKILTNFHKFRFLQIFISFMEGFLVFCSCKHVTQFVVRTNCKYPDLCPVPRGGFNTQKQGQRQWANISSSYCCCCFFFGGFGGGGTRN